MNKTKNTKEVIILGLEFCQLGSNDLCFIRINSRQDQKEFMWFISVPFFGFTQYTCGLQK